MRCIPRRGVSLCRNLVMHVIKEGRKFLAFAVSRDLGSECFAEAYFSYCYIVCTCTLQPKIVVTCEESGWMIGCLLESDGCVNGT